MTTLMVIGVCLFSCAFTFRLFSYHSYPLLKNNRINLQRFKQATNSDILLKNEPDMLSNNNLKYNSDILSSVNSDYDQDELSEDDCRILDELSEEDDISSDDLSEDDDISSDELPEEDDMTESDDDISSDGLPDQERLSEPEFSRIIHVSDIPRLKPVVCRLVAKEEERLLLQKRLGVCDLPYFAANVTATRKDAKSILVEGDIEARSKDYSISPELYCKRSFSTMLLNNAEGNEALFRKERAYHDEIKADGKIDLGEIATQYLSMQLCITTSDT